MKGAIVSKLQRENFYKFTAHRTTKERKDLWEIVATIAILSKMNVNQRKAFFDGRMAITIPPYPFGRN